MVRSRAAFQPLSFWRVAKALGEDLEYLSKSPDAITGAGLAPEETPQREPHKHHGAVK